MTDGSISARVAEIKKEFDLGGYFSDPTHIEKAEALLDQLVVDLTSTSPPAGAVANPVPQAEGVGGAATPPAAPPTPGGQVADVGAVVLDQPFFPDAPNGAITQTGDGPASVPCGGEEDDLALALRHVSGCARCLTLLGWDQ